MPLTLPVCCANFCKSRPAPHTLFFSVAARVRVFACACVCQGVTSASLLSQSKQISDVFFLSPITVTADAVSTSGGENISSLSSPSLYSLPLSVFVFHYHLSFSAFFCPLSNLSSSSLNSLFGSGIMRTAILPSLSFFEEKEKAVTTESLYLKGSD